MGRPRAIQQSRKVEQKSALTVRAKWEGAAFCWKKVIKIGKNFPTVLKWRTLVTFLEVKLKIMQRLFSFLSKPVRYFSLSTRFVVWSSKVMLFVFMCNMAYYHISPNLSRCQVKPYKAVIQLCTCGMVVYDNTFEILCTAPLTTEYFHISHTVFEHLLKKIAGAFLKQNF